MTPPPTIDLIRTFNRILKHSTTPADDSAQPKRQKMAPSNHVDGKHTLAGAGRFTHVQATAPRGFGTAVGGNWSDQGSADPDVEFLFERPVRNIVPYYAIQNPKGLRDTEAFTTMVRTNNSIVSERAHVTPNQLTKERVRKEKLDMLENSESTTTASLALMSSLADRQEGAQRQSTKRMGENLPGASRSPLHIYYPTIGTSFPEISQTTNNSKPGHSYLNGGTNWQANYSTELEPFLEGYKSLLYADDESQTEFTGIRTYTPPHSPTAQLAEESRIAVTVPAAFSPREPLNGEIPLIDSTADSGSDGLKSELVWALRQRSGVMPQPDPFLAREVVPVIPVQIHKFHKFLQLPLELRKRVYELALRTDRAIRPHLCDARSSGTIHFHDDNQHHNRNHPNHAAISSLLGITRVSKQVRLESLPCFYSANTFEIGDDTATYFSRLEQLNRFHMIRHVRFGVEMHSERAAAEMLEHMTKHIKAADAYDGAHSTTAPTFASLKAHPEYNDGGWLGLFICLRKLASSFTGSGDYAQRLVIPVPRNTVLTEEYATLKWFPKVAHGLGIHLQYLEGHQLAYCVRGMIGLEWHQQYQKKDFEAKKQGGRGGEVDIDVRQRTLELFPDLDKMQKLGPGWYMRKDCSLDKYQWYKVHAYKNGGG
jgi:hypothetical protein